MAEFSANPTDTAICRLLAAGPAPTMTLAVRLGVPERTVRHRLHRLRQAGAVVSGRDGLHRLAAPVLPTGPAGTLPARAAPVMDLAATLRQGLAAGPLPTSAVSAVAAPVAGPLPARVAPAIATDHPASDGPIPRHGRQWGTRTDLAAAALGLAVAGGLAVMVRTRRMSPPPPPAPPPSGFGNASDPWGSMRGPTW
jgi:DNA-binding transcriptional ArsR family regulator